jgi:hypothetical protein
MDQAAQLGTAVDGVYDVRLISNHSQGRLRVYATPVNGEKLMILFDIPIGSRGGLRGRLKGHRKGIQQPLYIEIARQCTPPISETEMVEWQYDDMFSDAEWIPEDITTQTTHRVATTPIASNLAPPQFNPLPITIVINAGGLWESRKTGRIIKIISAVMTTSNSVFDALLTVEVISNSKRKSSAKKIRLSSLFSGYLPKV